MRSICLKVVFTKLLFSTFFFVQAQISYKYKDYIGTGSKGNSHYVGFSYPQGIAIDSSGNMYVSDRLNNCIYKFNSDGELVLKWGQYGYYNGDLNNPSAITIDKSGNIYVGNDGFDGIKIFNSSGVYIGVWSIKSVSVGSGISGLAFDKYGNLYVSCPFGNTIQKYSSTGTFITQWGSKGSGDGQFNNPSDIMVDSSDNVYVVDQLNNRVQKFSPSGTYLSQWGSSGNGAGQFWYPNCFVFDRLGNICVYDFGRMQKFTTSGSYISTTSLNSGSGTSVNNSSIDIHGNIYLSDSYNNRILKFSSTGQYISEWGSGGNSNGEFFHINSIAKDKQGNIYASDLTNRIQKFSNSGDFVTAIYNVFAGSIAIDSNGYIYYCGGNTIHKISQSGTPISQWGSSGTDTSQFNSPSGIALDSIGNVYVGDMQNNRIQKFTGSGHFITQWGVKGTGNGEFDTPKGIAIDPMGNVFVLDSKNCRVQKFSSNGDYINQFGSYGNKDSLFYSPENITTDSLGNIYVTDSYFSSVKKFDNNGKYLTSFGSFGLDLGYFNNPTSLLVDNDKIYIADYMNRIQIFEVNQLPIVNIVNIPDSTVFTAPASINIKALASDPDGTINWVGLYNSQVLLNWTFTSDSLSCLLNINTPGNYTIVARTEDNTGVYVYSSPIHIIVKAPNQLPTVSIISPLNNDVFQSSSDIIINADAADSGGTISRVEFYNGTSKMGLDSTSPYSFVIEGVSPGNYFISAKAYDNNNGCSSSDTVEVNVTMTTGVSGSVVPSNVSIYPNPFKDAFVIENNVQAETIEVVNEKGVKQISLNLSSSTETVSAINWNAGIYYVRIRTTDKVFTKKIIKLQ